MTTSVDVLVEMGDSVRALRHEGYIEIPAELELARSAVAELIEACDHLKRDATNERWAAFHVALSRVKGA